MPQKAATLAAFTPDSRKIVIAGFNSFRICETHGWTPATPDIQLGAIREAVFSPDGKKLLVGTSRIALLCDAEAPAVSTANFQFQGDIACAAFSPDSRLVAIASQDSMSNCGEVRIWESQTGTPIMQPLKEDATVGQVEFSSDKSSFLTVSFDRSSARTESGTYRFGNKRRIKVWRLPRNDAEVVPGELPSISRRRGALAITNGTTTVTTENNRVRVQDSSTGHFISIEPKGPLRHIQLSPDKTKLATAWDNGFPMKGEVQIWDSITGRPCSSILAQDYIVGSVQFSLDSSRVLVACGDFSQETGYARVWDTTTAEALTPPMQLGTYLDFACFSPRGELIVTTGFRVARVWDAKTGLPITPLLPHPNCFVSYAEFDSDASHLMTTCMDPIVRRWNITPESRPVEHLIDLAHALSGQRIDSTGVPVSLTSEELQHASERLHEER
jgi:WD40 repeat protein